MQEDSVDSHPEVSAFLAIRNSDGNFVMVQGVSNGDFANLKVRIGERRIASVTNIAVTNGNTVDFLIETDGENGAGDVLPANMEIQTIIIQPHNGADEPIAVTTKWMFKLYTHSDRHVDDIFFGTDRTNREAESDEFVLNSAMGYVNEEGLTSIPCSLTIPGEQQDATFTVKIIFN